MRNLMLKALSLTAMIMVIAIPAMAQTEGGDHGSLKGFIFGKGGAGAIAVAIAAAGAAIGDSRAVSSACEGVARNPGAGGRIFTMMMIGLVMIETLVLITFAASFLGL